MEDTLITFETAKLAKEKGLCEYFKNINPTKYVQAYYSEDKITFKEGEYMQEDCVIEDRYFRPTQSLLAKWLREKHNIIIIVDYEGIDGYYYKFYSYKGMKKFYDASNTNYKTYEEAFEIGSQEALKLIK